MNKGQSLFMVLLAIKFLLELADCSSDNYSETKVKFHFSFYRKTLFKISVTKQIKYKYKAYL